MTPEKWCSCGNPTGRHLHSVEHEQNAFELRMWKEGYAAGFKDGFEVGEDIGRDRN